MQTLLTVLAIKCDLLQQNSPPIKINSNVHLIEKKGNCHSRANVAIAVDLAANEAGFP
jgi:hypothetical protein